MVGQNGSADVTVTCECHQRDCTTEFLVGTRLYTKVRRREAWRFLATGHEVESQDAVLFRQAGFVVVEAHETRRRAAVVQAG
jgi:hypothetical protein